MDFCIPKRFRSKIKVGKNICSNIKAVKKVNKPTEIFATRFQPDITESDIKSYITNESLMRSQLALKNLKRSTTLILRLKSL